MSGKHFTKYIGLLLLVVVMALASTQAFATQGGGNEDCPSGTIQIAKFNWDDDNGYVAEGNTNGVSITGDTTSGTFNSATYPIAAVVVKGAIDAKIDTYNPAVTSGSFDNTGLSTPNDNNTPAISNIKFCKPEVVEEPTPVQDLILTSMCSDDPATSLNWRVRNPNNFPVDVTWEIYPNQATGTLVAQPGDNFFSTNRVAGDNTVKIYWQDENGATKSTTKASGYAQCEPQGAVKPVLECVIDNYDGTFTARFGYLNENTVAVEIPVGANNKFTPAPEDRGQTTVFQPGRVGQPGDVGAFSVVFDGSNLVWTLKGPDGSTRTSTASSNSKRCPDQPPATGTLTIQKVAEGGEDVTFSFGVSGPSINTAFNIQGGGLYTFEDVVPGVYTIVENETEGWEFDNISCSNATLEEIEGDLNVTVEAGKHATCTVTNVKEAAPVCEPDWQKDLKHELSYIIGVNGTTATATITNKSELCEYPVGFASYEKFDEIIDNQSLFDSSTTVIKPGETITLTVNVPLCAAQLDLFYGDLITSFANGVRYGVRLLDALHIGGTEYCDRCTDPDPARDLKHSQSRLIANDMGRIVNLSETCSYEVGIASYKKFDDVIDHQHLFDYTDTIIEPGQTLELSVALPECAVQVDLYYGTHLESLYKQRYGSRLLDARHLGGSDFCTPPDTELVCTADQLGAMSLNVTSNSDKLFVQASFASGTPTHVVFQLGSITWTELFNPYIFMGDGGWDISNYSGDATNISVKAYSGALICQSGSIDIAQYLPEDETEVSEEPGTPNQAPVVILPSQTVEISGITRSGAAIVTLDASQSYDPEGTTLSFQWHNGETAPIQQVRLGAGTHDVWVTVTDAQGKSSTGLATITVLDPNENVAPVAVITGEAELTTGIDGTVTVTLSGLTSFDSDGTIAGYLWNNGEITDSITVTLNEGLYTFTLTVIDDDGASSMTSFSITVMGSGDSLENSGPTAPIENGKTTPGGDNEVPIEPPADEASM